MKYKQGQHPNSRAALKPAKKGEVRNPHGRQKLILPRLENIIVAILGGPNAEGDNSGIEKVVKNIFAQATNPKNVNSVRAAALLIEKAYGSDPIKIQAAVDHTTKGQSLNKKVDVSKLDTDTIRKIIEAARSESAPESNDEEKE